MPLSAIFGLEGPQLGAREGDFLRACDPFGVILFARNVGSPDQLKALTGDVRALIGRDVPIFIDQEGGRVQRMGPPHWHSWIPPMEDAMRGSRALELRYRIIAAELHAVGIDANCAPCLDVATPATHPFLRNRCLSEDARTVAQMGRVIADALLAGGVLPVMKHMPGHGAGEADSHGGPVVVRKGVRALMEEDFLPFQILSDLPMAMTGHMIFESMGPKPTTFCSEAVTFMRDWIGFNGLLITDDLSMNALSGDIASRASRAISAGCDVVLHCNGDLAEMEAVAEMTPKLAGRAADAAEDALARRKPPDMVDLKNLIAEYTAIT